MMLLLECWESNLVSSILAMVEWLDTCTFLGGVTFLISEPLDGNPASHGNGATIGFKAEDGDTINEWHKVGQENGGTPCEDPPGVREGGGIKAYLGYLRDPSNNKICTMCNLPKS
jgi:hypothetical protein